MLLLNHCLAAGLLLGWACGDSDKPPAAAAPGAQPAAQGAAPLKAVDACALLTQAEAEAILKKAIKPPQPQAGGRDCWYQPTSGGSSQVVILSVDPRSWNTREAFKADVEQAAETMKEHNAEFTLRPVPNLGDAAFDFGGQLWVLWNQRGLVIMGALNEAQARQVAEKAGPRL